MNGKRAKQLRRISGGSIANRRGQREFERQVAALHAANDDRAFQRRIGRRQLAAFFGLFFFLLALGAVIAEAFR